jgi:WD40 repeat protein
MALAWSPQGNRLATGSVQGVQTWKVSGLPNHTLGRHDGAILALTWSADGKTLASAGADGFVRTWNDADGTPLQQIAGHPAGSAAVAWSKDGEELAVSGFSDHRLRLWATGAGKVRAVGGECGPVAAWSPNGKFLAVSELGNSIRLWDAAKNAWIDRLHGHTSDVLGLAWTSDSERLTSASADGTARLWRVPNEKPHQTLDSHQGSVFTAAWAADQKTLSLGTLGAVHFWNAATAKPGPVLQEHTGPVRAIAWSPDGRLLATGAGGDALVLVRDWTRGALVHRLATDNAGVSSLAWSPKGKWLAAGTAGGDISLWDAVTGRLAEKGKGHTGPIHALSWSALSDTLASAGSDGTVRLWQLAPAEQKLVLLPLRAGQAIVVHSRGHWTGPPQAERQLVYVVQTEHGQQTLSAREFQSRYGWKNDPALVTLAGR